MTDVDLAALSDAGAFVSREHQAHLAGTVRLDRWRVDPATAALVLTDDDGGEHRLRAHLVGTASPDDGSWLWGWENPSGFPPAFVRQSERVRDLGRRYAIPELTTPSLALEDGLPERLVDAVKALTGLTAHHVAATGNGATRAWLLLDDPGLGLPAPTVARAVGVVTSALAGGGAGDHRRALTAWAQQRGAGIERVAEDVDQLNLSDGALQVRYDAGGRIAGLGRRLRASTAAAAPIVEPDVESVATRPEPEPPPAPVAAEPEVEVEPATERPTRRGLLQRLLGR
ncbi:DUF6882 domain-containing protein [Amnibacterium kyonggiense]|uniref:Uncharacterized protein n=1 Tax=Amnibacterium kyonggiense TaxID=595671 RepID=A0A4R7FL58_9MICO|nr:DUF6882 domain-containing protein [Amnibacterium kyonggiense]TDS77115.1 hypothetical protein CLV52_2055 [Amnibacterium kyonggiense]